MPIVKCRICRSKFYAKPFWLKRGFGTYCSAKCQHTGQRTGRIVKCFLCGTESYKTKKALTHSKSGKFFCSKSCQTKWRNSIFIGEKHANWRSGRFAYKTVLTRANVKKICKLCGTKDARVLAIHHVDLNHFNNKIANLVWLCHNCHVLVHHYNKEKEALFSKIKAV